MPVFPPIIQSILILLAPGGLLLLEKTPPKKIPGALGVEKKNLLQQLFSGVKLFLLVFAALLAEMLLLNLLGAGDAQKVVDIIRKLDAATLLAVVFIAPVGEELLFRGYLQKKFGSLSKNGLLGVLLASALFAALHAGFGSVSELLGAFTAALLLGEFVRKNRVILPAIVAHALVNAYSVAVSLYAQ